MSKISNLIFNGADHYITSPYGYRNAFDTAAGKTSSFHSGTDYGTNGKKLPQYAIEDGIILSCGKDSAANGYALYVWVKYPRINKKFLHYHLDSIAVKKGQSVKKGTLLGCTGMTGKATGIHLHLGVKDLETDCYIDPEAYAKTYVAPSAATTTAAKASSTASSGFKVGDTVKIKTGAKSYDGKKLNSAVYGKTYRIDELSGKRAVLDMKGICTAVNTNDLTPVQIYSKGNYKVTASLLNVRTGAGTNYKVKLFNELTANAQAQIKALNKNKAANGLVAGCTCTVSQVNGHWGKIPSGWICLDYCKKI